MGTTVPPGRTTPKHRAPNEQRKGTVKNCLMLCAVLGLLLVGCKTPPPDTASHYDALTGLRTDIMADNLLETEGTPREVVYLNASRVFRTPRLADYYLEVTYMATVDAGFLDIPPGESLTIIADGKELKFRTIGSSNLRKTTKDLVHERALYETTKDMMQKIATAKDVKVRLQGRNGLVQRDFKPVNSEKFQKFVSMFAL
jgi:hypothetical protein